MANKYVPFIFIIVGGGSFISTDDREQASSRIQATALAMLPQGVTPIAFFASNPISQSIPATSVIFKEEVVERRRGKITWTSYLGQNYNIYIFATFITSLFLSKYLQVKMHGASLLILWLIQLNTTKETFTGSQRWYKMEKSKNCWDQENSFRNRQTILNLYWDIKMLILRVSLTQQRPSTIFENNVAL